MVLTRFLSQRDISIELIHAYLDSNKTLGLNITYSHEETPLGTIGPLRLIENLEDTFLVMNGDILTDLNLPETH